MICQKRSDAMLAEENARKAKDRKGNKRVPVVDEEEASWSSRGPPFFQLLIVTLTSRSPRTNISGECHSVERYESKAADQGGGRQSKEPERGQSPARKGLFGGKVALHGGENKPKGQENSKSRGYLAVRSDVHDPGWSSSEGFRGGKKISESEKKKLKRGRNPSK